MSRLRALLTAATLAALSMGAFGAPAAAVDPGHVVVVNGIPGKAIDVCINGQEVKSGLRYGRSMKETLAGGQTRFKIAIAAPGKCKGSVVYFEDGFVPLPYDYTYVATAKAPKRMVFFNNAGLGTIDTAVTDISAVALRHAADLGEVLWIIQESGLLLPSAVPPKWEKGDSYGQLVTPYNSFTQWVTKPGKNKPLAGPIEQNLGPNRRYEFYLVGTNARNARIVTLVRKILPLP